MTDLLMLQERVKNTIQLGESHFREFKTAFEGAPGNKNFVPPKIFAAKLAKHSWLLQMRMVESC
jgi:ATP-dependent DNA helicase RecG